MLRKLTLQLLLFLIIIIGLFCFWDSYRSSTIEAVIVESITKKEMRVTNLHGRERTIVVPLDLTNFLEVHKQYTVSYDKRILDKYILRKIDASTE